MKKSIPTFCRVCEPSCGLTAEVECDRLVRLWPDDKHPVTRGFACHKGLGYSAIHHDPDRLNVPERRISPRAATGQFEALSWPDAIQQVADALKGIREKHGGSAIAG